MVSGILTGCGIYLMFTALFGMYLAVSVRKGFPKKRYALLWIIIIGIAIISLVLLYFGLH